MTDRVSAIAGWWSRLSLSERHSARMLARTEDDLPTAVFHQLVDANVLVVTDALRRQVDGGGRTFPMPADIRSYVLDATAASNGSAAR